MDALFRVFILLVLSLTVSTKSFGRQPRSLDDADTNATRSIAQLAEGNVRFSLNNDGNWSNPAFVPGYIGLEFPAGSGNAFMFSGGLWVGAVHNGARRVSTATDGDNGTREFWPVHIDRIPGQQGSQMLDWQTQSRYFSTIGNVNQIVSAFGIDDDSDWNEAVDDVDENHEPSRNYDGGKGMIGVDDDGDGITDEETANDVDDDGDSLVDEDTNVSSDANGDGNCYYDPEPEIDEDPIGDISSDGIDNDYDGLADNFDDDFDGDVEPGSRDDDGDGLLDEDGTARVAQEFIAVYQDSIQPQYVRRPDADGHAPLDIVVRQHAFVHDNDEFDGVVLLEYSIQNMGNSTLDSVFFGLFTDPDIVASGEGGDAGSLDDACYFDLANRMMVIYDDQHDPDGWGPGVLGIRLVNQELAPSDLLLSWNWCDRGTCGDPSDDAAKYATMSSNQVDPNLFNYYGDMRMYMGWGSATNQLRLEPGQTKRFEIALICGLDTSDVRIKAEQSVGFFCNHPRPTSTQLVATIDEGAIRLSWNSVNYSESGCPIHVSGYRIYRTALESESWDYYLGFTTDTTFTDTTSLQLYNQSRFIVVAVE